MKRILFFLVVLLFLIAPAFAETESLEFEVILGNNILDLNTQYDNYFIHNITANFTGTITPDTNPYCQEITLTTTDSNVFNNSTTSIFLQKNQHMASDFRDLRFYDSNFNKISYYISQSNSTTVEILIKTNQISAGSNKIYASFGNGSLLSESNVENVYLYYQNTSTQFGYQKQTIYSGGYSNLEMSQTNWITNNHIYFNLTETGPDFIRTLSSRNLVYTSVYFDSKTTNLTSSFNSTFDWIFSKNANGTSNILFNEPATGINFNLSTTGTVPFTKLEYDGISSGNTCRLNYLYIYNSTNFSIQFGNVKENIASSSTVNMPIPSNVFSNLDFYATGFGHVNLKIDFTPHVLLITENNTQFEYNNTKLEVISNKANSFRYQIALDSNFYSIVDSGFSTGNISVRLPNGDYFWRIMQPDGTWTETRSFTVTPEPEIQGHLNILVYNELTNAAVSATVKLTNETTTLQKTGANITFNSSEVIAGNYSVQLNATGYTTRFYDVVSPGNYTLYVLPNANASVVYFSLIDNTNTFQYDSTKLEIIKQTPNGSLVVHHSYFDATGFSIATLNNFDNYILKVVSDSGHEKILGNYIQAGQTTVQLVISDIILKENNSSLYGGFTYNLTKSESAIKLDWINPNNALTDLMLFQIYKNNELVMNISTDAPFGSINYQDNVDGEMKLDPDATYRIVLLAKTVNGTIRVNEFYKVGGESVSIDFEKIPLALRIVISLILLILVASLFNVTNAKFSAIVVTLVAGFLTLIGFLPILPSVLIWLLFVAIVAYKTNNR